MLQKLQSYVKKTRIIYSKKGIKGMYDAIVIKVVDNLLPTIYENRLLRKLYHPLPKTAFLELTNKCNLRCKMCIYQKMQEKTGYISRSNFEDYVNQLSEMKLESLSLHFGGESLIHPDFKDFLKYAISRRDQGKIGSINWTDNGMLFNQDIADLVVELKVDSINFSLDGVGQINDDIRLGSKYSVIEKNIKYLLKKRGSDPKPTVKLLVVDYGKTDEQKLSLYREWVHLVDEISLIPSILPDNTWENKNTISQKLKTMSPPPFCSFPLKTIAISWDGKVTGCCLDYAFKMVLGDATKESIKQIWWGSKFQALRKAVLTNTFHVDSPCYGCEFWQVNFEPRVEQILDGKAKIEYGYIYRKIQKKIS